MTPAGGLLAVHISSGVLANPWWVGGFVGMAVLLLPALWRVSDAEVPRIGVLTAAFFVASQIHFRVGPTSAHLILNGLVGVTLGRRAPLAITVGLVLQALLLQHGGLDSLGVNACIVGVPAVLAGWLYVYRWIIYGDPLAYTALHRMIAADSSFKLSDLFWFQEPFRGMLCRIAEGDMHVQDRYCS